MMSMVCVFCCVPGEGNRISLLQLVLVTTGFQEGYNFLSVHQSSLEIAAVDSIAPAGWGIWGGYRIE